MPGIVSGPSIGGWLCEYHGWRSIFWFSLPMSGFIFFWKYREAISDRSIGGRTFFIFRLSRLHPLQAKVGETVRIFFRVGGPNYTSSFHVIGEILDKVYTFGGVQSPPHEGIQTVTVAPGGAVIVDFKIGRASCRERVLPR